MRLVLTVTSTVLLMCGCAAEKEESTDSAPVTPGSSKSMEQAIKEVQQMRREMTAALEQAFGPPRWGLAPDFQPVLERAGCPDDSSEDGAEVAGLPTWSTATVYPESHWRDAADRVAKIGRKYGFDRVRTVVDRPGDLEIDGRAPDGGQYVFGFGDSAILQITTGCYVWKDKPQGLVRDSRS
ncbi:LppA family lipoprotein [Marmoricola endophyticus]|uniref:LppA family lipoprotein n=1 Tax=Marmoricola endophyticus TaxID=2040280 RepID=UPI00166D594E|nr:LppA family lipoprotein [Marmoricola endophyticus]